MIDAHCHLEWKDYDSDRDDIIRQCREHMKAVITSACHPQDFEKLLDILKKHKGFVFGEVSVHPEFIKEIPQEKIEEFFVKLEKHKDRFIGIGETGLDYFWVKEESWREKQKDLFKRHIECARTYSLPLTVHSREADDDTVMILEEAKLPNVHWHLFGSREHVENVIDNNWKISVGPILLKSKKHKKIVRDLPLEQIMLETDSPWFGIDEKRGYPWNVKFVAQKIAQIKKIEVEEVLEKTTQNAIDFFTLPIQK